jgi:hypothetical protein
MRVAIDVDGPWFLGVEVDEAVEARTAP